MLNARMNGRIRLKAPTYAIAVGDDAKHYFFMPTDVLAPSRFETLREDVPVQFTPYKHECIENGRPVVKDRCTDLVVLAVDPHLHAQHHHGSAI